MKNSNIKAGVIYSALTIILIIICIFSNFDVTSNVVGGAGSFFFDVCNNIFGYLTKDVEGAAIILYGILLFTLLMVLFMMAVFITCFGLLFIIGALLHLVHVRLVKLYKDVNKSVFLAFTMTPLALGVILGMIGGKLIEKANMTSLTSFNIFDYFACTLILCVSSLMIVSKNHVCTKCNGFLCVEKSLIDNPDYVEETKEITQEKKNNKVKKEPKKITLCNCKNCGNEFYLTKKKKVLHNDEKSDRIIAD